MSFLKRDIWDCQVPPLCPLLGCLLALLTATSCTTSRTYVAERLQDWQTQNPPPDAARTHRVFLIGDVGSAVEGREHNPVLDLLKADLQTTGPNSTVILLGDNVPCCGLPDSGHVGRTAAEASLRRQLDAVKDAPGNLFIIPGDDDWNRGKPGALAARNRLEAFVEAYLDRGNVFIPDDGFPGPVEVDLTDRLTVLFLDTQWWLSDTEKPFGDTGDYDLYEAGDFLLEIENMLRRNRNKDVLLVGHHPLLSNGKHGGHFSRRTHLLPTPILGSLYPLYRRYVGKEQDLAHGPYVRLRQELKRLFEEREVIYAAGHDHSLQYFKSGSLRAAQHYVVSGAGAGAEYVARGRGAGFTAQAPGYVVLNYYEDNAVWLEAWSPGANGQQGRLLFRYPIKAAAPAPVDPTAPVTPSIAYPDYTDSTVVVAVNPRYAKASGVKRFFRGDLHRDLWATPVEVPILDIGRIGGGGATPVKSGGRGQSITLRMEGVDGKQYVLRSIDKVAGRAWTPELQSTFLRKLIQDQMAMLHPYGAFILPPMADAAGVYHTNPRAYYVPDDPRLGLARDQLAGQLVLLEERPDGDMSDVPGMGGAEEVISYSKLFREIDDDNDHRVDERAFARARLFDMLIADWDRHPDQWRWAAFEPADSVGKVYRPIPRDRDVAFSKVDGLVPTLSRILFDAKFQDFGSRYGYIKGLNKNGFALDRRFTAALTRADWIEIADSIRVGLTDQVIEDAVRLWPDPIFEQQGEEVTALLKVRRDQLGKVAAKYYDQALAPVVDVVGSHKHERFEVTRLNDKETEVVVYKTSKEGVVRRELYRRTFLRTETREIRLYGQDGQDQFIIRGTVRRSPFLIAVGGVGEDMFVDESHVQGFRRKTRFHDSNSTNHWTTGAETRVLRSDQPSNNTYDFFGHKYDLTRPTAFFGSNKDDGLLLGGGVRITKHRFRKQPFAQLHLLRANLSTNTQGFNIAYEGHFTSIRPGWDLLLAVEGRSPTSIHTFYGFGNDTEAPDREESFFWARQALVGMSAAFQKRLEQGAVLQVGPKVLYTKVRRDADRFIGMPAARVPDAVFEGQWYAGLDLGVLLDGVDEAINPRQGFRWTSTADINLGLSNTSGEYSTLASALSLYISLFTRRQTTLALRAGASHTLGDFPFYAGSTLGGKTNLRGYVSTRFTGKTGFFHNAEVRAEVLSFKTYLAAGTLGVLGFFDNGRVWSEGESSRTWHQGYGGGLWVNLFNRLVLTGMVGQSEEDRTLTVQLGFFY